MNKFANIKKREIQTHADIQSQKHPGGRPKKSDKEKKNQKIYLSLTKEEKERLESLAKEEDIPLGTLVRKILKKHSYI